MNLNDIADISWQRACKWHENDTPWTTERWITAIVGELGEMANISKKLFRAGDGAVGILKGETTEALMREERKEWADTMLYMLLLASSKGWDPEEAMREVFNAKSEQLGFEQRL
jgi:NTP pyrophosphatase (non-canonical NTP hydrolase)